MKKPTNNLSSQLDMRLARDLIFLYVATVFFQVQIIDTDLMTGVLTSPMIMLGLVIALYILIEVTWLAVRILDRITNHFRFLRRLR